MRPAVVFVEELEDAGRLLGRFSARFEIAWRQTAERAEGLTIDEAIAWGRERAGFVLVRFGRRDELWSAGATPHWSYPSWPPPDAPPLVPRPVPQEDRDGAELMWAVTIHLTPKDVFEDDRESWDEAVAASCAAARLPWDRRLLDGFLADAGRGEAPFSTFWSPVYRVYAVVPALRPADAEAVVAAAFTPPDGFLVGYRVRPADLTDAVKKPPEGAVPR